MRRQRGVDALLGSSLPGTASVREYVLIGPARKVELGTLGQEREACRSQRLTALARQHAVKALPDLMQMKHVARSIAELRLAELGAAPVGTLQLLRQLDAEQLLAQVLEPVPVGVGAGELGRDLGAIYRAAEHAQILPDDCQIVAREMEQLLDVGVGEQSTEIRSAIVGPTELHQVAFAIARRELYQTQPVAIGIQAHRFGIHGDHGAEIETFGQVLLVQVDRHVTCSIWPGALAGTRSRRPGRAVARRSKAAVKALVDGVVPRRGLEPPRPFDR